MENFIIDHFSVTKRHNVQQTIEVTNSGPGRQRSLSEQTSSSEQLARSGQGGQEGSQQAVTLTHQSQIPSGHMVASTARPPTPGSGSLPSSTLQGDMTNWVESSRARNEDRRLPPSPENTSQRSQQSEREPVVTSPFFRELLAWGERTSNAIAFSDQRRSPQSTENVAHRSPQVERAPFRSPQLERVSFRSPQLDRFCLPSSPLRTHRTSWIEQSNLSSRSPGTRRSFSFEQVSSPPGLRRTGRGSASWEHARNSQCEALPPTPPLRTEREHQRTTPQSENLPPNSPFRTERPRLPSAPALAHGRSSPTLNSTFPVMTDSRSPQSENVINAAISGESSPAPRQPHSLNTVLASCGNPLDTSGANMNIRTVSKPKLVRLRSEPSSPSFSSAWNAETSSCCSAHSACALADAAADSKKNRRRREELKRSQSFEARSPSCQEALWMGINMPSQLVITRPQLCRTRLNRKHLSLHLEDVQTVFQAVIQQCVSCSQQEVINASIDSERLGEFQVYMTVYPATHLEQNARCVGDFYEHQSFL
ncbi:hypothetical protein PoB_004120500 [Plakobranchus ocellatus]|uniref:Uncharacterized protein n=1 Tax=Plakobranchus ocellatus TaxID=259542 RepID=A0AAV4B6L4_9GAST|nr:hypothetical protein PoB_004120500 [Plakobranchus ocellatus]